MYPLDTLQRSKHLSSLEAFFRIDVSKDKEDIHWQYFAANVNVSLAEGWRVASDPEVAVVTQSPGMLIAVVLVKFVRAI